MGLVEALETAMAHCDSMAKTEQARAMSWPERAEKAKAYRAARDVLYDRLTEIYEVRKNA